LAISALALVSLGYFGAQNLDSSHRNYLAAVISRLQNPLFLCCLGLTQIDIFRNQFRNHYLPFLLLITAACYTLVGSRSAVLRLVYALAFLALMMSHSGFRWSVWIKSHVIKITGIAFLVLLASVGTYVSGSSIRNHQHSGPKKNWSDYRMVTNQIIQRMSAVEFYALLVKSNRINRKSVV